MSALKCDTAVLLNQVAPSLSLVCNRLTNASSIVSGLPVLEGCEAISNISSQIDKVKKAVNEIKGNVETSASYAEKMERENETIIDKLGDFFTSLLGGFTAEAGATENTNPNMEPTNLGIEVGEPIGEKLNIPTIEEAYEEFTVKQLTQTEMESEISRLDEEIEKIKANGIYGNPASDNSLAAQISRDKVAALEKEKNDLLALYNGVETEIKPKDIFGGDITYTSGYEKASDVMAYAWLKPSSGDDGQKKPLIVWLHGNGEVGSSASDLIDTSIISIINESGLDNFDAYVIAPHLAGDYWVNMWCKEQSADYLADLLDKFIDENNVDTDNIIVMGTSLGGQGALYMATDERMSNYFSQAVILSGYPIEGVKASDAKIPVTAYVATGDTKGSRDYAKTFAKEVGNDNLTELRADHITLPSVLYNLDSDGDGKSDFIQGLFTNVENNYNESNSAQIAKLGNITNGGISDRILEAAQKFDARMSIEGWEYSNNGLIYHGDGTNTIEDVANHPNKIINCAGYVAGVLYNAGELTTEDILNSNKEGRFNANYPINIKTAMVNNGWEKQNDISKLEPGSLLYYPDANGGDGHIEIFGGWDENGDAIIYNGGNIDALQHLGPEGMKLEKLQNYMESGYCEAIVPNNGGEEDTSIQTVSNKPTTKPLEAIPLSDTTKPSEPNISEKVEIKGNGEIIKDLGTDAAREELFGIKQEIANQNTSNITKPEDTTKPSEPTAPQTPTEPTKPSEPTAPQTPTEPTKPTKPTTPPTPTEPIKPSIPEDIEIPIIDCTPEAIIEAAKNYEETTSHSEYILDILHESGFFTKEQMKLYENYNLQEIREKLVELGWEREWNKYKLQVGDIIFKMNAEGEHTAQIYAGENKWYMVGSNEAKEMELNWTENVVWYAYRPVKV